METAAAKIKMYKDAVLDGDAVVKKRNRSKHLARIRRKKRR